MKSWPNRAASMYSSTGVHLYGQPRPFRDLRRRLCPHLRFSFRRREFSPWTSPFCPLPWPCWGDAFHLGAGGGRGVAGSGLRIPEAANSLRPSPGLRPHHRNHHSLFPAGDRGNPRAEIQKIRFQVKGYSMAVLKTENIVRHFGGLTALNRVSVEFREKRDPGDHRAQRGGENHPLSMSLRIYLPTEGKIFLRGSGHQYTSATNGAGWASGGPFSW